MTWEKNPSLHKSRRMTGRRVRDTAAAYVKALLRIAGEPFAAMSDSPEEKQARAVRPLPFPRLSGQLAKWTGPDFSSDSRNPRRAALRAELQKGLEEKYLTVTAGRWGMPGNRYWPDEMPKRARRRILRRSFLRAWALRPVVPSQQQLRILAQRAGGL